jgi:cytochrome c553
MKKAVLVVVAIATALLTGCSNIERSRNLADPRVAATTLAQQVCSNCHGVGGNAVSPNFPNLAGQIEPYIVAQLNGFKSHGRRDPAGFEYMWGLSRSLSDDQIKGLAAYYATQQPTPQPVEGERSRLGAGKSIFENGVADKGIPACSGCHGAKGEGNAPFPRIAGQHVDYVVKQLLVFQRTDERPEGVVMKTVAHDLTQQHIRDVATYVQALPSL